MAHSPKRLTRRDIRRPDHFITLTGHLFRLLSQHKILLFAALSLAILAVLGAWSWTLYTASQNRLAAKQYAEAKALYQSGNYQDALNALEKLPSAPLYKGLALLHQARLYMAIKENEQAITAAQGFLRHGRKDPVLRQIALLTLAYAHESKGDCQEAFGSFLEAEKSTGPFKDEALLGKARCSARNGAFQEALTSYRQYLSTYATPERSAEIVLRIQELEGKIAQDSKGP